LNQIGNYKLLRKLGEGGMGAVFLGHDLQTKKEVAVKIIKADIVDSTVITARFRQEIKISKQFAHPYIIKVLDGGLVPGKKLLFLVMEYLKGSSLGELCSVEMLSDKNAIKLMGYMAEALSYIHSQGVVHRDIKPDNIFVVSPERAVLLDFGLALAVDLTRLSKTSECPGTFITMSPEQILGDLVDGRSDIYSLGVTMYWSLTGTGPYETEDIIRIATGNSPEPPPSPFELNNKIDKKLSEIIMKSIEIDRNLRFSSAEELLAALNGKEGKTLPPKNKKERNLNRSKSVQKSNSITSSKKRHSRVQSTQAQVQVKKSSSPKRLRLILPFVSLLILLLVASKFYFLSDGEEANSQMISSDNSNSVSSVGSAISKPGEKMKSKDRKLNDLVASYLKSKDVPDIKACKELGILARATVSSNIFEAVINENDTVAGLYYLYHCASEKEKFEKAYEYMKSIVVRFGTRIISGSYYYTRIILFRAAKNSNRIEQLIAFYKNSTLVYSEDFSYFDYSLALIHAKREVYALNSRSGAMEEGRKRLKEALVVCRKLKKQGLDISKVEALISLYFPTLASLDSHEYRKEGLDFFHKWIDNKYLSSFAKVQFYYYVTGLVTRGRKGFLIPEKDRFFAIDCCKKGLKLGATIDYWAMSQLKVHLADNYSALGKHDMAQSLFVELLKENSDVKIDPWIMKHYGIVLKKANKFEESIKLLEELMNFYDDKKNQSSNSEQYGVFKYHRKYIFETIENCKRLQLIRGIAPLGGAKNGETLVDLLGTF